MDQFSALLQRRCKQTMLSSSLESNSAPEFIYQYKEVDRTYGTPEYVNEGVFNKTTTPWLNSYSSIPASMLWTPADLASMDARTQQVNKNNELAEERVPGQTYSGTIEEQVLQRFSKGFFNAEAAPFKTVPAMTEHWIADDREFARQRMGANNPNVIRKFGVAGSDDNLAAMLADSNGAKDMSALTAQLEQAEQDGRLFIADYRDVLGKVETIRVDQYFTVPMSLFIYNSEDQVMDTVAIQLRRGEYWFAPADADNAWLLAKLYAASADSQWWYSGAHLFNTHSIDMVFGIAALNVSMPDTHPVYQLVKPNIKKVFDINTAIYNMELPSGDPKPLYNKGGDVDKYLPTGRIGVYEIINALYENYSFDEQAFPALMSSRGMDRASMPASFPYRDDGELWWGAVSNFIDEFVDATYASDAEVAADSMLNDWLSVTESAFNHDGITRLVVFNQTRARLKELLTNLYFLTTVQHTGVNNTMFDGLALVPNGTFAMKAAAPSHADGITDSTVLNALPDPQDATDRATILWQITFVMNGTATVDYLASTVVYTFDAGSPQQQAVDNYYSALQAMQSQLEDKRATRVALYQAQNPGVTDVPNSVAYTYLDVAKVMACIQI